MKHWILFVILLITSDVISGQQLSRKVISNSGTSLSNSGLNISFTLGEVSFGSSSQAGLTITPGFNQPEKLGTVYVIQHNQFTGKVVLFPTPASSILEIEISIPQESNLFLVISSIDSKIMFKEYLPITKEIHRSINIESWPSASYVLHITDLSNQKVFNQIFAKID